MKKIILVFGMITIVFVSMAQQLTTTFIFSKMDITPQHTLWDGSNTMLMGYTSLMNAPIDIPGPTLTYTEGDSVELKLRNMSQGASHTIHLHGLDVDQWNDGVPHLSWEVGHNETKSYYFKAPHPGTYLYHCHFTSSLHVQAGMYGLLIVDAQNPSETWDGGYAFHKEYAWMTSELDTVWHTDSIINAVHDTTTHLRLLPDYNPQYFLVNGRSEHQLLDTNVAAITAKANETILLRLANIGYYGNKFHFPMHLNARIISSDGRPLPSIEISDTLDVLPGERYQVLLQSTSEIIDSISVKYFNLNTQNIESIQMVPVNISGFISSVDELSGDSYIYPNPTNGKINLVNVKGEINIYDSFGKLILKTTLNTNEENIDVSHLNSGVYFIKTTNKNFKFLKL
jgi:FtsP/CotA-like multicopper oxidase with cupredoxin domain